MSYKSEALDRCGEVRLGRTAGARIISLSGHAIAACTVCNLSASGALLRAVGCGGLERGFGLLVDGEDRVRNCEIAWQLAHQMGVRFVRPAHWGEVARPLIQDPVSLWSERAYLANW